MHFYDIVTKNHYKLRMYADIDKGVIFINKLYIYLKIGTPIMEV